MNSRALRQIAAILLAALPIFGLLLFVVGRKVGPRPPPRRKSSVAAFLAMRQRPRLHRSRRPRWTGPPRVQCCDCAGRGRPPGDPLVCETCEGIGLLTPQHLAAELEG